MFSHCKTKLKTPYLIIFLVQILLVLGNEKQDYILITPLVLCKFIGLAQSLRKNAKNILGLQFIDT